MGSTSAANTIRNVCTSQRSTTWP